MEIWIIVFSTMMFYFNRCSAKQCWDSTSTGTRALFCCDNHEEINGTCVACRIGFSSKVGEHCTKCQNDSYGFKCISMCKCRLTESCHHVLGCIEKTDNDILVEKELTVASNKLPQVTYPATSTSLVSVTKENSFLGLSKREIIVYSSGTGGFTCLLLFLLFICHHKLKNRHQSVLLESNITQNNVPIIAVSTENTEGIYETIDESNMIDVPFVVTGPNIVDTTSSEESTDTEHSHSPLTNEYLNPYQQIVPDPDKHEYNFVTNDSGSSRSSGANSAYLNPYQQIVPDPEKHEYTFATYVFPDESESSGSSISISGYLNPYQQIIPDSDPHKYLSIQAEIHCLDSFTFDANKKEEEHGKEKNVEHRTEFKEEIQNEDDMEFPNLHSLPCLGEKISNSEMELKIQCTSINDEIPVENFKDNLPVDVISVDEVKM